MKLTPNLMVTNVNESILFYQEVLNMAVYDKVETESAAIFAILGIGETTLMLEEKEALIEEYPSLKTDSIKPSLTLFIKVEDVEAEYERLKSHPNLVKSLHKTFYDTWEFALTDPDGVVITLAGGPYETGEN
ncbi:VOC family protein [Erysipelothrix rhusiopathiae]|uniref:VOC family protein n=1 Tax=Erysipelothrix rhusiopathiae TaxID=1648 RepID=UPI001EDF160A|nr:VOC family protein [Erysipelothrix rhusiopathiae]MCG4456279.1 VOC family protein [Erysipelothrix rhusiopathiae]MDE8036612.1 VOC family protein [Erysipelothrix rhusiopathiae]MDE8038298.1 VOC family protein [Erysipelothrix rhusiopathiae]MDE8040767.1 VOC family protein [Erysipelothrix rhusiopathiae]MDE8042400.1 VOC family protein [Erysipelothrix rhusiopathiae]